MAASIDVQQYLSFERINVVGTSGCGKTTFAREFASLLQLPLYEMDQLFWKPGWQQPSDDEFLSKVREVTSKPRWVLDGNYNANDTRQMETGAVGDLA